MLKVWSAPALQIGLKDPKAHQSTPSSDAEQDGAEVRSALGPPPTGPPSTVSRSGRVVHRAAKVSVLAYAEIGFLMMCALSVLFLDH